MKRIILWTSGAALFLAGIFAIDSYLTTPAGSATPAETRPATAFIGDPTPTASQPALAADVASDNALSACIETTKKALVSRNDRERHRCYATVLPEILARDPMAAVALASLLPPGPLHEEYLQRIAKGWAEVDLPAATAWADSLADRVERHQALTDICLLNSPDNPTVGIAFAEKYRLTGSEQSGDVSSTWELLAGAWARQDPQAAAAWAAQRPHGDLRELILTRIAEAWPSSDAASAAQFVADRMQPGPRQTEAAIAVLNQWAQTNLPAAKAWAEAFPAGPLRDRAVKELSGMTAYQLPDATSR